MSNRNYETQILDAIQMVVDNAVSKASYDKTIQATISKCVDEAMGKYVVKYQNSSFYAYSYNRDVTYSNGTLVYVLVPGNDMGQEKSIIGTVDKLGIDYVSITEGENGYQVVGINNISSENVFGLCSYKKSDIHILYDSENQIDLINLDTFGLETYIKKSNSLICGASFKTNLNREQQFNGNYGIVFSLDFVDNATGETVTRNYVIDTDNMVGQPYNFLSSSRQYEIFPVDGSNFISVRKIYIFSQDFPKATENDSIARNDDIFVSKFELSAANALPAEERSAAAVTFITPQGVYFNDKHLDQDTKTIEAQVKIKGKAISRDAQDVKYYWFRENNKISSKSENYNKYGGNGWECLNLRNIIEPATEDSEALVEWVPHTYNYITTKAQNIAKETNYKCVVVYDEKTVLSKTFTIYNYSSNYNITIESDSGTSFYYDLGNPTLTCKINGQEELANEYEYVWSSINNLNKLTHIEETPDKNQIYNEAAAEYNELKTLLENNEILAVSANEEYQSYKQTLDQYEYVTRIEKNKIYKIKISEITNFTTYKCSVYKSGAYLGSASIILSNSLENENGYTVVINNGNQVFKYNENGVAPNNKSLDRPIDILPLTFTMYDHEGREISAEAIGIENIKWVIPIKSTLLTAAKEQGDPIETTETTKIYSNLKEFNFDIATRYDLSKSNNNIQLIIEYKQKTITTYTNFTFIKTGEIGTNGTDYVCKIVPYVASSTAIPKNIVITHNEYLNTSTLNYQVENEYGDGNIWFKAELWHNGELAFEGSRTAVGYEDIEATVKWSILKNNYGNNVIDNSNLIIDENTGAITFDPADVDNPANIVKCIINYDGVDYYATIPVIVARIKNENYEILLADDSGFKSVMYTADGQNPIYDSKSPFEITVKQNINGIKEDISLYEPEDYKVEYDWDVRGTVYYSEEQPSLNLIKKWKVDKNQRVFQPSDTYNGLCVNNAVVCTITQQSEVIGSIHIPVHMYLNRYGNSAMNGWDGNSVSINEDNSGLILAPQVGAGTKNENDNSFTGVFMGTMKETGKDETEYGLFGYQGGERTIALSATDGSARFGKAGSGQIVIDPSQRVALISSGDYSEENKKGMQINLSEPSIKWGNGNFEVDKDGQIWATQYATKNMKFASSSVEGLDDQLDDLDTNIKDINSSINYLDAILPTNNVTVETDTTRTPIHTATKTLECVTTYKGTVIKPSVKIEGSHPGITNVASSYDTERGITILSFHVDSSVAITDATNNYNITFSYNSATDCSPVTKIVSILVIEKGRDGTSVNIKGTETNITTLCQNHSSGNALGDGYILADNGAGISGHLFIYTNDGKGNGSLPNDWKDVGKIQGNDGTDGRGVQSIEYEYLTNNSSIKPSIDDSNWGIGMETPTENNRYLWQKEIITFIESDGTQTPQETVFLLAVYGKAGNGISSTEIKYQEWTDATTIPGGEWLDNPPEVTPGNYLWTRIRITYTDNSTPSDSYSITYIGKDGESGADGVGVKSLTEYYALAEAQPTINDEEWKTFVPTYVEGLFYWKKIVTEWTDSAIESTIVIIRDDALTTANQNAATAKSTADKAKETADETERLRGKLETTVEKNLESAIKEIYMEYCQTPYEWIEKPADNESYTYEAGVIYYSKSIEANSGNITYYKTRPTLNENNTFVFPVYVKQNPIPPTAESNWSRVRPQWIDGKAIYQRTVILYNDNSKNESEPYIIEDYQTIDDLRYQDGVSVLSEMRGTNNIFYNSDGIFVYNGGTKENSTHAIIINNAGILFQHRESLDHEWDPASSVWTIEGHFDAKDITVSNLTANSIVDGTLTLGNNSKDGELLIKDDQDRNRAELSSQRSIWTLNDGSSVIIGKDCGFQVVGADGVPKFGNILSWTLVNEGTYQNNTNYYTQVGNLLSLKPEWTRDTNGNLTLLQGQPIPSSGVYTVSYQHTFAVAEQKITNSVNFNDMIRTTSIETTDGAGIFHRGIAFVPKN